MCDAGRPGGAVGSVQASRQPTSTMTKTTRRAALVDRCPQEVRQEDQGRTARGEGLPRWSDEDAGRLADSSHDDSARTPGTSAPWRRGEMDFPSDLHRHQREERPTQQDWPPTRGSGQAGLTPAEVSGVAARPQLRMQLGRLPQQPLRSAMGPNAARKPRQKQHRKAPNSPPRAVTADAAQRKQIPSNFQSRKPQQAKISCAAPRNRSKSKPRAPIDPSGEVPATCWNSILPQPN